MGPRLWVLTEILKHFALRQQVSHTFRVLGLHKQKFTKVFDEFGGCFFILRDVLDN